MPDYKRMYFQLAGKVADAIELLTQAQLDGEESAMADNNLNVSIAPPATGEEE